MQVTTYNPLYLEKPKSPRLAQILELMPTVHDFVPPIHRFNASLPLIDYHQKSKLQEKNNLFSEIDMPKEKQEEVEVDETYYPHIKREINFHMVCDTRVYHNLEEILPHTRKYLFPTVDRSLGLYAPILYISDFWLL